ncbi:MAG TPA: OmpA family protein [Candidatus Deferrimicrobiaceae bacterium]
MPRRSMSLALVVLAMVGLGACTRFESTYVRKVQEADNLAKQLSTLQGKYREATAENEGLKAEVARLTSSLEKMTRDRDRLSGELSGMTGQRDRLRSDLSGMTADRDKLAADNRDLEKVLRSKADSLSQSISELRGKVAAVEDENSRLRAQIAGLNQQFANQQKRLDDRVEVAAGYEKENAKLRQEIAALQRAQEEKIQKTSKTYEDLLQKMKGEIAQGQMTITELKGKLTVNMVDAILFDSGKAEVKPEGMEILKRVISILKDVKDKSIRIEGHTDNVQIIGMLAKKYPTNWELSAARAINVARFLQEQGIDPGVLSGVAYGEYHPVAANDTPEGKQKNRRIEIILVPKE